MEESSFPRHLAMIRECRCLEFDKRIYNVYMFRRFNASGRCAGTEVL
jgi:hypothetical protein